jgi:GWxTD domain-containing protein
LLLLALCLPCAAQRPDHRPTGFHEPYEKWLDEDARWIITDQECGDFRKLTTDQQRDDFIEKFWERRNPTPGAPENTFKEEHYRRIAFANLHFGYGRSYPGFKTDRGRMYIMYGPPESIDHHYSVPASEKLRRGDKTPAIPFDWEIWHYPYIEGLGEDIRFEFVDTCYCGEFQMRVDNDDLKKYSPK